MSLITSLQRKGPSGFGAGSTAEDVTQGLSLTGKTYLVTGCNSGLGLETLRVLALRGAKVIGTGRTKEKAQEACDKVAKGQGQGLACELSDPKSVKAAVDTLISQSVKLDGIICNAGIMALPKLQQAFGYELQFFTNHIGHFILVTGLLNNLTNDGRVVMLSSAAHFNAPRGGVDFENLKGDKYYKAWTAYGQSKFANLAFAKELARRFKGTNKTANAVHPGVIATNLARHMNPVAQLIFNSVSPLFLKTPQQGAATQCFVATHPSVAQVSGKYFANSNEAKARYESDDPDLCERLWEVSEEIQRKVL